MSHPENDAVLVFGATGRQGGGAARALRAAGRSVRALVRDPASAGAVALAQAGVDVREGGLDDMDAVRSALDGARGVFLVLPGGLPDGEEEAAGVRIAGAAEAAGVAHLVYSSGASVGERLTGVSRLDAKPKIEARVRELGVPWTIVRPVIFMEMLFSGDFGLRRGEFEFFPAPDQSMQLIASDDIGRLAAAVFADPQRFIGRTLRLAGDTVTGDDIRDALSAAAAEAIRYRPFDPALFARSPDLRMISESLKDGPLSRHVPLEEVRAIAPDILSLPAWLAGRGRAALEAKAAG